MGKGQTGGQTVTALMEKAHQRGRERGDGDGPGRRPARAVSPPPPTQTSSRRFLNLSHMPPPPALVMTPPKTRSGGLHNGRIPPPPALDLAVVRGAQQKQNPMHGIVRLPNVVPKLGILPPGML